MAKAYGLPRLWYALPTISEVSVKKIVIGMIALALVASGAYFAIDRAAANPTLAQPSTSMASPQLDGPVLAEGKVVPAQSAALNFTSSGVVAAVLVKEGDMIEKGASLARLDTRDRELKVAQAEAVQAQAQAHLDKLLGEQRAGNLEQRRLASRAPRPV
jgi:HlyD family secretion protein